jgi:hypothetical protein
MNKIIKILFIGILMFVVLKLTFGLLGLLWALLTHKYFWISLGVLSLLFLIIKYYENILDFIFDLIDDIVFEIQWAMGHYKNKNDITLPQRDINKRFYDKLEEIKTDIKMQSQSSAEQKLKTSMSKKNDTSIVKIDTTKKEQETYKSKEQPTSKDLIFSFVPELYTDFTACKEDLNLQWMQNIWSFIPNQEHRDLMAYLGPHWYPSAYRCNKCYDELYKTVFPIGREFQIKLPGEGTWHIKRAFTCPTCERIYAPKPGYRYTELYATYQAKNEQDYREKVTMMGVYGTTEGRQDI